ncbi:hypothetical protein SUGI_0303460 [Cryptomeria japonica]|nr:hypothetical protein SUGI_0303460 [Cryptomeria japonica]
MECAEIVQVLSAYEDRSLFPSIAWLNYGEGLKFYPGLDKGFRWGFVCAFSTLNDLHEFSNNQGHITLQNMILS